ncbi:MULTISPECIES: hypothetical protein [unclassified Aureispira]|uniref:leucine-rich repeat domain-containing protein n=1 Tax=unclassified Aureispira TaxID=2649989 RepID=UPI00069621CA|nr:MULTISPECIES: hypothetical protein [unclassified Aureispira]WMX12743.1 hypothetical protein QP953_18070 [Aureispira sp. CCB-E]
MQLTSEELKNLSSLLLSTDDNNTQIAFEILDAQNFPKELLTEAFVVFKLSENEALKRKAAEFLHQQKFNFISEIMNSDRRLIQKGQVVPTEQTIKKNIDAYVKMSKGALDGMKMALAMYHKYGVGLKYLLDRLPTKLKKELLSTFITGTVFKINDCALTAFPSELYSFKELTEIDLSSNKIKTIPTKIKLFQNLEILNVSSNKLDKLNEAIVLLPKLKHLDISNNKFVEFPMVICKLKQLEHLNIMDLNHLLLGEGIVVPPEINQLKNIQTIIACNDNSGSSQGLVLDLRDYPNFTVLRSKDGKGLDLTPLALAEYAYRTNGKSEGVLYLFQHSQDSKLIKQIIEEQFYVPEKKLLDLKSTILVQFPIEIKDYDIEHINFSACFLGIEHYASSTSNTYKKSALRNQEAIDDLFSPLEKFKDIKTADLSSNRLAHIPTMIKNWKKLTYLDLSHNTLNNIDNLLSNYPDLEVLHLRYNQLKKLPKDVVRLRKLRILSLSDNIFTEIPKEIGFLPTLEELKFNSCLQTVYDNDATIFEIPDSWGNLKNLKKIHFYESRMFHDHHGFKKIYKNRLEELLPEDCEIYMEYV